MSANITELIENYGVIEPPPEPKDYTAIHSNMAIFIIVLGFVLCFWGLRKWLKARKNNADTPDD
jgi:hypothetical protein